MFIFVKMAALPLPLYNMKQWRRVCPDCQPDMV